MTEAPSLVIHITSWPPSTNKLWARGIGGKRVRSREYREWRSIAGWEVKQQIMGRPPLDCRFDVLIEVPISRRDTDNWTKPCLDLCQLVGAITNDGNAREVRARPVRRDGIMIAFWPLPGLDGVRRVAPPAKAALVATKEVG